MLHTPVLVYFMLCIRNDIKDPYYNLAAEEYLLKESNHEFLMLYINDPSIIIGKHQNTYAEINLDFVKNNNIRIARRISGGGTVWHDHGNLNFSFIVTGSEGDLVNFRKYASPILDVLLQIGLHAAFKGKNSITINDLKVSGNAEHIYKNRVLHHGTLLFNSDLSSLREALRINPLNYHDRAVKSIRSQTANISDFLIKNMGIREFSDEILKYIMLLHPDSEIYTLTSSEHQAIQQLAKNKYSTWEWNFGYSPDYIFERKVEISGHEIGIYFQVKKGFITEIKLSGYFFQKSSGKKLEYLLLQKKHEENVISEILNQSDLKDILNPADMEDLIKNFF